LLVIVAGAVVRLGMLWWFNGSPLEISDERDFNGIAVGLVTSGEFSEGGTPSSMRPPLYPAFLATVYLLFGVENYQAVRTIQAAMGLALSVAVYLLAKRMYSVRAGVWAAAFCCFYPSLLFSANFLLTETLFSLLLATACLALHQFFHGGYRLTWLGCFGILWGLASLTRSVLWLLPPFVFVFMLWAATGLPWYRRVLVGVVPLVFFALTIAPWSIRNTQVQKTFVAIDNQGGRNFMMGNYEYTPLWRAWDAVGVGGDQAWYAVLAREYPEFFSLTQGQRDSLAMKRGLKFIVAHPLLTLKRSVIKFFNFWQLEREVPAGLSRGYWGNLPPLAVWMIALLICASYAGGIWAALFGAVMAPPSDRRMYVFVLLVTGLVCAVHTIVFGHSRYHLPLMPLLLILAAGAVVNRQHIWQHRKSWRFALCTSACAVLAASWVAQAIIDKAQL